MRTEALARRRKDYSDVANRPIRQRRRIVGPSQVSSLHNSKDTIMPPLLQFIASVLLVFTLLVSPVRAQQVKAGDLVITQAWSRATPGGAKVAGGYLTIENRGSTADRLIGGSGDITDRIEVHEMTTSNGVMTMRALDKGLVIKPGKTVKLAPGGYHLMMFDLKSPLKQGDKMPVTLEFEEAGKVKLSFDVLGVGAQGPAAASGGMDMDMDMKPGQSDGKM
jgi:periplasmic copper chaperone A